MLNFCMVKEQGCLSLYPSLAVCSDQAEDHDICLKSTVGRSMLFLTSISSANKSLCLLSLNRFAQVTSRLL